MEETSRNVKWLFSEDELTNTPSVRAGITLEQEMTFRQKQAMLIQTVGLKSGLTQLAVNTSVIFMHRFFMHRPVKAFPRLHLALGFAFAGGKVEESARKLEHLIRTAVDVIRVNRNKEFMDKADPLTYEMDAQWKPKLDALISNNCNIESTAYQEMRKLVLECETEIYAVIGFQLQIVHPHNYVIRMCALLGAENIKDISQYAYNLATASSQLTMLCLKHRPETIATMCLNIAAKAHSVRFEPMKDSNLKWYQVIVPSTDFSEIEAVSEEFLHLIKGCPLLPSWMQNLARMSRANNRLPGPSRAPGTSVLSGPQVAKPGHQPAATASSATAVPQQAKLPQPASTGALSSQSLELSRQAGRLGGSQLLGEAVLSPVNKPGALDVGGSAVTAEADVPVKDQIPSTYPRPHVVGGSSGQIMGGSSGQMVRPAGGGHHHHQQQQQHRVHPHNRPPNQPAPPAGTSAAKPPQPSGLHPSNSRSAAPQHTAPPGAHMSHLQTLPRSSHDRLQHHQDPNHIPDTSRPHSESVKHSHDPLRQHRDHYRSHDVPARPHESTRHRHVEKSLEVDSKHPALLPDPAALRTEPSRLSPHTPPISPTQLKSVNSPELAPDISQSHPKLSDAAADLSNATSLSPEDIHNSDIDTQKQRPLLNQGSKLSLTMYRERAASAKSRMPSEQGAGKEDSNISFPTADELHLLGHQSESATDSPADVRHTTPTSDLSSFSKPQDSPSNPRIKIKVKRDPSSGERHSVKYADSGLKIKIKPLLRSETGSGGDTSAGPGMAGLASTSSTPREEGEIVEDTPPSSGDSEQKSERLKIRLSVPKADHSSATYSRRESDQGSNGFSGDRERDRDSSGHRSHHHSHHRGHHHSKSKKHSKHDRSRHDAKSSKRSSTALDYHEERPAKTSRGETYSSGESGHRHGSYSEFSSSNSSRSLQHQNSGFSINDAFSSTMPHNIFHEEDDEGLQGQPPITPTSEAVPPHHQKFHQLMAQHRAKVEASKKPPLPRGPPPPPPPSSPPPPPPSSPPTL